MLDLLKALKNKLDNLDCIAAPYTIAENGLSLYISVLSSNPILLRDTILEHFNGCSNLELGNKYHIRPLCIDEDKYPETVKPVVVMYKVI